MSSSHKKKGKGAKSTSSGAVDGSADSARVELVPKAKRSRGASSPQSRPAASSSITSLTGMSRGSEMFHLAKEEEQRLASAQKKKLQEALDVAAVGLESNIESEDVIKGAEREVDAIADQLESTQITISAPRTATEMVIKQYQKQNFKSVIARNAGARSKAGAARKLNLTMYYKDPSVVTGLKPETVLDPVKVFEAQGSKSDAMSSSAKAADDEEEAAGGSDDSGSKDTQKGFGTWDGVYVSCLLNIFGVIMFLRLGWVVGQAGIIQALAIILLSGVVTTLTTMSMSAICTNGKVKGGGAYYLISRSLGPALGGAIGALFTLGMCVACAMYVIGFCETLVDNFKACPNQFMTALDFNNGLYANKTCVEVAYMKNLTEPEALDGGCSFCDESAVIMSLTGGKLNDMRIYGIILITFLLAMALIGTGWVIKLQLGLLALLVASIISFVVGCFVTKKDTDAGIWGISGFSDPEILAANWHSQYTAENGVEYNFFSVFSIFFPAVTGIMAGANISGLLRNPSKNIPKGTFAAISHSTVVYCILAFLLGAVTERSELLANKLIMQNIEIAQGVLVLAGVYAATFSSALASLVGAPQLLGAVARDFVLPLSYFTVTHRREPSASLNYRRIELARRVGDDVEDPDAAEDDEYFYSDDGAKTTEGDPVRGYLCCYVVVVGCVCIGELNVVAPLISMFFMLTYGLVNLACFALEHTKSPGWRPTFTGFSKWGCLTGFVLCIIAMFLTSVGWALGSIAIAGALYYHVSLKVKSGELRTIRWGTAIDAQAKMKTMNAVMALRRLGVEHAKTFRPTYLVFTGHPSDDDRMHLCRFVHTLRKGYGGIILGEVITKSKTSNLLTLREQHGNGYFKINPSAGEENSAYAPLEFVLSDSFLSGAEMLIQTAGLGAMRPNTVLLGYKEDWRESSQEEVGDYVNLLRKAFHMRLGVMVGRGLRTIDWDASVPDRTGTVDVWWLVDDGGLTMLVPHLMTLSKFWKENTNSSQVSVRLFFVLQGSSDAHSLATLIPEFKRIQETIAEFRISWSSTPVYMVPADASERGARESQTLYSGTAAPADEDPASMPLAATVEQYENMPGVQPLAEQEHPTWTLRWLRIGELVRQHSGDGAKLVYLTMPFPRSYMNPADYMGWLESLTADMPPVVMIRGNGRDCITRSLE